MEARLAPGMDGHQSVWAGARHCRTIKTEHPIECDMDAIEAFERADALLSEMADLVQHESPSADSYTPLKQAWCRMRLYVRIGQPDLVVRESRQYLLTDGTVRKDLSGLSTGDPSKLARLAIDHLELMAPIGLPPWFMLRMEITRETGEFSTEFTYRENVTVEEFMLEDPRAADPF